MTTSLTFHMSSAFLQELTGSSTGTGGTGTQNGSWAYLWNETPPSDVAVSPLLASGATNNWTPLVLNGSISSNVSLSTTDNDYEVTVTLTDASLGTVSSSSIYLIVQSENPAAHTDLTQPSGIGSNVGQILPNSQNWNYSYAAFEVTLTNASSDLGDLTAIPGFAWNMAVNIKYDDSTGQSRGLGIAGQSLTTTLSNHNAAATQHYPTSSSGTPYSPLDGQISMVNSPSNSTFGPSAYPTSEWSSYLSAVGGMSNITLSGMTNGEPDANGVWHNAQYYSYNLSTTNLGAGAWGSAGTYFVFSPNTISQTQGYILISQATLQSNMYAAGQGTMTIWEDSQFQNPFEVPGSAPNGQAQTNVIGTSANNQWGNILTPFFTGFTAGYWGTQSQSPNTMMPTASSATNLAGGTIDLNTTLNWSPAYAFDVNRVAGTTPSYQHNDWWSQQFFNDSNIYGSAFSDNLSVGLTTGPLIPLSQPDGAKLNVGNIDLYVYGSSETPNPSYFVPVATSVYLPLPGGQSDYLTLTTGNATMTGPQLIVSGQTAGLFPESTLGVQLGLYQGNGQFTYVPLTPASNSNTGQTDYWQNFNLSNNGGTWTATSGGPNVEGTFIINNMPISTSATANQVYWYQLVFTDTGGDQKVYNFYATQGTGGTLDMGATDFAADGGATYSPVTTAANQTNLVLNPAVSMPVSMLVFDYNSQFSAKPAAPVGGTLSGSAFTPFDGQTGIGITGNKYATGAEADAPTVNITTGSNIAFGWTGYNNDPSTNQNGATAGWTTAFTNKIVANNTALVTIFEGATQIAQVQATADLDGQWLTTADPQQFGNGTYTVTMQEYLPGGTTVFGAGTSAAAPSSAALTLNVNLSQLALQETAAGDALQFAPHGSLGDGAGNWLHFDPVAGTQLAQGAQLLLYATTADGTLVGRDGTIGGSVSIADATLARLGSMSSDGGIELLKLGQTLFLPDDQQLHFALLNPDGTIAARPDVQITPQSNSSMLVSGAGLSFMVTVDNGLNHQDYLASDQRSSNLPVVYLTQGETIHVEVAGSAKNANTVHFVRFDYDHDSNTIVGVGGVAYGNTDAFRAAVQANWDANFAVQNGNGTFHVSQDWSVGGKQGFYAPVLVTPNGDIFVPGTANIDGRVHVQTYGENVFAFEDVRADHGGDFDYNDMVVKLSVL